MTRVVFAPDSFKGSITAIEAARALADGWSAVDPHLEPIVIPMADGGEGTLAAIAGSVAGARWLPVSVRHPTRAHAEPIAANWVLLPPDAEAPSGTGVVELASTAGIELLAGELDPWHASTSGFGQAIAAALDHGVDRLVLAIGSSASSDGGVGMLAALGAEVRYTVPDPPEGAAGLSVIAAVDLTPMRPPPVRGVRVITDVTSPLLGAEGAAARFGIQKGFQPDELPKVDAALAVLSELLPADPWAAGAGAAGGTGLALLAWGATLTPGAPTVADVVGLEEAIARADFVVTGEGSYDEQSALGKLPGFVLDLCQRNRTPVAVVAGRLGRDPLGDGFSAAVSLTQLAGSADHSFRDPRHWLHQAGGWLASWAVVGADAR